MEFIIVMLLALWYQNAKEQGEAELEPILNKTWEAW